ncbi:hypothetical protein RDWZM_005954 [Blomia tropicalis]|uniref:Uncharacterized protein n=1 Tax=Blomia tropicalis TaxID=40697 RepID=A0A9Q0M9H3_BLOTA|nr:La- protein 7 [Blomia tropicalis]KAJ6220142.1 hypothetical protein RDWZM_005954 [Blomia tropicalis]
MSQEETNLKSNDTSIIESKSELYRKIREQISYYFSDANLRYDKYLKKLINVIGFDDPTDGQLSGTTCISLSLFLNFNKIAKLTTKEQDLVDAFIEVPPPHTINNIRLIFNETERTIGRLDPFPAPNNNKEDVNARTIYVEGFDVQDSNCFQTLKELFEKFGLVLSVRTPRFNHNQRLMGFAFIEFNDKQSAERALCELNITNKEEFRILSKAMWTDYRNRYLRLQKESSNRRYGPLPPYEDPDVLQDLADSFNLMKPIFLPSTLTDSSDTHDNHQQKAEKSKSIETEINVEGRIVRLELHSTNAMSIGDPKSLRKQLRTLIESSSVAPSYEQIAYIDIPSNSLHFNSDGSVIQSVYIRTHTKEAANSLNHNDFRTVLNQTFHSTVVVNEIQIMELKQANDYWQSVMAGSKKRFKKS